MDLRDALATTGEDTARFSERLRNPETASTEVALQLMGASKEHIACLIQADMAAEGLATGVITLLTVLACRISPDDIALQYCDYLQTLYVLSTRVLQSDKISEESQAHLVNVSMELGALTAVTDREFSGILKKNEALSKRAELIDSMFENAPADFWKFKGEAIIPTMAMDVLADCGARLAAIGLID